MKQTQTATHGMWTVLYCLAVQWYVYLVKSRMWALKYTHWGSEGCVRNKKCSRQPWALDTHTVHRECSRIGNSEILACNVSCRVYKNMKMIRLIG